MIGKGVPRVPAAAPGTEAWPFLVGSGRTVPQRVILAPPFLLAASRAFLLLQVVGSAEERSTMEDVVKVTWACQVSDDKAGDFTVVFRISRASAAMAGEEGIILLDSGSRPVHIADGVVLRGQAAHVSAAMLNQARAVTANEFSGFWKADDRSVATKLAAAIEATGADSFGAAIPLTKLPPLVYPATPNLVAASNHVDQPGKVLAPTVRPTAPDLGKRGYAGSNSCPDASDERLPLLTTRGANLYHEPKDPNKRRVRVIVLGIGVAATAVGVVIAVTRSPDGTSTPVTSTVPTATPTPAKPTLPEATRKVPPRDRN
jgi:hypothetical protein